MKCIPNQVYTKSWQESPGLKHCDCPRVPKVLQCGNSNHPAAEARFPENDNLQCLLLPMISQLLLLMRGTVTLNARVCKQQVAQQDSFSMLLVLSALPTSETLITGCLHIPLVPHESCHTFAAAVAHCINALLAGKSQVMNLSYTHFLHEISLSCSWPSVLFT